MKDDLESSPGMASLSLFAFIKETETGKEEGERKEGGRKEGERDREARTQRHTKKREKQVTSGLCLKRELTVEWTGVDNADESSSLSSSSSGSLHHIQSNT